MSIVSAGETYNAPQTYVAAADWEYPAATNISMFGPVLLPKIYGSNLSELEVASDGQIILSVNNNRAIEIEEDSVDSDLINIKGLSKKINLESSLSVIKLGGATSINNTLSVQDNTFMGGTLSVSGATELDSTLNVDGATTLTSTLSVTGATELDSTLNVDGVTTLGSFLSVSNAAFMKSHLSITGDIQADSTLNVDGATTLASTLSVTGATELDSTLNVDGATTLTSTLSVTGATELDSTLNVDGATTLGSTLSVTGAAELDSTLNVDGATTLGSTLSVTNNTFVGGSLSVTGATELDSTLNVDGATTLTSTLSVTGATELDSTLNVDGATTLGSTLSVTNNTFVGGTLSVTGAAELDSTLNVDGVTTLGSFLSVSDAAFMKSHLSITGGIQGDSTLNVNGATTLASTLSVTGVTELASNVNVIGPKFTIPRGTEAVRPSDSVAANMGSLYYNTELHRFEGLFKTGATYTWNTLGGVIDSDQNTHILAEKNNGDQNTLFFTAENKEIMTITNKKLTFNASNDDGSNVEINADLFDLNARLEVADSLIAQSNLIATAETELRSTLSVTGVSTFDSDIRMNAGAGVLLVPQYVDSATYEATTHKKAENEGSIIYDTNQGIFLGLNQPANGGDLEWRPIGGGGLSDADGDTSITAETTFGSDEDTLVFKASTVEVARMSNDKFEIKQNLSVSAPVNVQNTMTVNGNTSITGSTNTFSVAGATTLANSLSVGAATVLNSSLSVGGESKFAQNVTIAKNQKLYSETTLTNTLGHYDYFNENGESMGKGTLDMYYENVFIHGNLDIGGSINQSSTQVQELFVEDKSIVLGTKSENTVRSNADGSISFVNSNYAVQELDMNQAGIKLSGLPNSLDDATYSNDLRFEKSILWKVPSASTHGTSNLAMISRDDGNKHVEPFWDIKGGHLRLTTNTADDESAFVSFAFRINSKEQLELVKIKSVAGDGATSASDFKTIAKFGSISTQTA